MGARVTYPPPEAPEPSVSPVCVHHDCCRICIMQPVGRLLYIRIHDTDSITDRKMGGPIADSEQPWFTYGAIVDSDRWRRIVDSELARGKRWHTLKSHSHPYGQTGEGLLTVFRPSGCVTNGVVACLTVKHC